MRKSILLILLILLAFSLWTVTASGKAKKEENVRKSSHFQKSEPAVGPEAFPQVVLPKAHPVHPTAETFENMLMEKKNKTPEQMKALQGEAVPVPADQLVADEKTPYYCRVRNQGEDCCYYQPGGNSYLYCWGQIGIAVLLNLDHNYYEDCPYPLYPFQVTDVRIQLYVSPDTATIVSEARIFGVDYSGGEAYPSGELCSSDTLNPTVTAHEGAWGAWTIPLAETCCVYDEFFAVWVFDNSDDFNDTDYCTPIYLDYVLSLVFDASGRTGQAFWNPYGLGGSWYDMVVYGILSGVPRVEVYGYTADQNTCLPPDSTWYYKEGMPDFYQYNAAFPDNGAAYCGPTAGANSIWWFSCVQGYFSPSWGGCVEGVDEIALINEIAAASSTDPVTGTECDTLEAGIINTILAHGGWWFEETTVYQPDFWYLQKELRDCEDVILLLGFWQTTDGGTTWQRFGGHFVTLAGVDIYNLAFAFSDPATTPAGYQTYYAAWPSESPGGYIYLPDYSANWSDFQDQNFRAEHEAYHGTYNLSYAVYVEIEQAIVVSPGIKEMTGQVNSAYAYEIENNHGGVEAFDVYLGGAAYTYGLYYGSLIAGTSQEDLNCDYGDYYPVYSFDPLNPPTLDTFTVTGEAGDYTIYQLTINYAHKFIPELQITKYAFGFWVPTGGVDACEYVVEDVLVLHNTGVDDLTDLQTGMLFDYDIGASNACDVDYDQKHQSMWMWESGASDTVFGLTKTPAVAGDVAVTGWGLSNPGRIYDGQYVDSLKYWMENLGWGVDDSGIFDDKSLLIADNSFTIPAGEMHIEKWLKWGYGDAIAIGGDAAWRHFLYDVLHQQGYFRGDVNRDRKLSLSDIVYLISYLMKSGAEPYEFADQGDVNNDDSVSVSDIVYLINFQFKHGSAPVDRNRFLMNSPYVDSTHQTLGVRDPGLFAEPDWMFLGQ